MGQIVQVIADLAPTRNELDIYSEKGIQRSPEMQNPGLSVCEKFTSQVQKKIIIWQIYLRQKLHELRVFK